MISLEDGEGVRYRYMGGTDSKGAPLPPSCLSCYPHQGEFHRWLQIDIDTWVGHQLGSPPAILRASFIVGSRSTK